MPLDMTEEERIVATEVCRWHHENGDYSEENATKQDFRVYHKLQAQGILNALNVHRVKKEEAEKFVSEDDK